MLEASLVTSQSALDAAVFRMQGARRLALDTEFLRERTYFPQLCLVQIATDADCFLVDPLAGLDLAPLYGLLADRSRPKILHSARQDLELLSLATGSVPGPLFDTQIAAALLGLMPQVGYAEIVARRLGHSIDKRQTRTDWSRRPLSAEQLAYAADDVRHLLELHSQLEQELESKGRRAWLDEESVALEDPSLYRTEPDAAWRRLKGLGRLRPREQVVARALAGWREERAIASDKPRGWILSDETLLAIVNAAPRSIEDLEQVRSLPPAVVRKRGEELLALVEAARTAPVDGTMSPAPQRPTPEQQALASRLMQVVREEAEKLGISAEVLATRRDIDALAQGSRDVAPLRGWRGEVLGAKLRAALPGG
jgi:ribonuclease D